MNNHNKIITKKHILFGEIRFQEGKPYLIDIAKSLNYKDDSYIEFTKYNTVLSKDNIYLLNDEGINILISNSNTEIPTIYRQWMFDYILPSVRRQNVIDIIGSSENTTKKMFDELERYIESNNLYTVVPVHGFSNNYMFYYNRYNGRLERQDAYKRWIKNFPKHCLDALSHIDFTKPITAVYKFDHQEKYDTPNFGKSLSDVIAHYFNVDDHQIEDEIIFKGKTVKNYKDAKTYIYLYNK